MNIYVIYEIGPWGSRYSMVPKYLGTNYMKSLKTYENLCKKYFKEEIDYYLVFARYDKSHVPVPDSDALKELEIILQTDYETYTKRINS